MDMKKFLKDWKSFEIALLLISVIAICVSTIICKSGILTCVTSLAGVLCALLQAKGKIISQWIGLAEVMLYSILSYPILSYQNDYYGEVIIYVLVVFPMYLYGVISWITHKNEETDTVNSNQIAKQEWIMLSFGSIFGFVGLYYVLKYFDTSQLIVSSLSMVTSLLATYLIVRRSKFSFLFYVANDIILVILWGIPLLQGDFSLMPILIEPVILLINDSYGWKNWNENVI